MEQLKPVEKSLGELFKNAPKMSEKARQSFAKYMPWIALVFGVLQLLAALTFWRAGHRLNALYDWANEVNRLYGTGVSTHSSLGLFYWLALIVLAASALILLAAYPGLAARKKSGWDWLFLGTLVNLAYGVVSIFVDDYYGGGFGRLVSALIGSAISFYLLYQVRDIYTGKKEAPKAS